MKNAAKKQGARSKLREYFLNNIGIVLQATELREVSGNISEWARRIRELRTEEGYQILTHNDLSALKPGQYLLKPQSQSPHLSVASPKKPARLF